MSYNALPISRAILHPEVRVVSGAWVSRIGDLMRHGWQFEVYESHRDMTFGIMMKNPETNMVSQLMLPKGDARYHITSHGLYMPEGGVLSGLVYREIHAPEMTFITQAEVGIPRSPAYDDFHIYTASDDDKTQEFIVTPDKVAHLMSEIRRVMEPGARELLHKQRRREERRELEEMRTTAKILTFAKAG